MRKRKPRWDKELAEYRRLLAKQITVGSRETVAKRQAYTERQVRINRLYRRLY